MPVRERERDEHAGQYSGKGGNPESLSKTVERSLREREPYLRSGYMQADEFFRGRDAVDGSR